MKNTKKIIAIGVILVLLAFVVAGCSMNTGGEGTSPTNLVVTNPTEVVDTDEEATAPTTEPATVPTIEPTTEPTTEPVTEPTEEPTTEPTEEPTEDPLTEPTEPPATEPPTEPATQPTEPSTEPTEHIHSYQAGDTVKPTCGKEGYTVYTCSCGATYNGDFTSATGHAWTEWTTTREATVERDGEKMRNCTNCGMKETKRINKLPEPSATEPPVTEPPVTEPPVTQPTEPPTTAPTEPAHVHSYSDVVTPPTCEEAGYTEHYCSCGAYYWDAEVPALGHDLTETFIVLDDADMAYTMYECKNCNYCKSDNYIDYVIDASEVEAAIIKYINQYRAQQGSAPATYLPGMAQVAKYRSVQLTTNFAHDTTDTREALAYYQYGEWVDMSEYGYPGYYRAYDGEAIGRGCTGSSADEIGKAFATGFRNSAGHWSYVGSSEYPYIGVGCTKSNGEWFCCVMVGMINFG